MAENDSTKSVAQVPKKVVGTPTNKSISSKSSEFLSVSYNIERTSGLRISKKSNSFRAASGTNIKSLIGMALKKIKFSTRYKYVILYFDSNKSKWRKFKDRIEFQYGVPVRLKVCRFKVTPKIEPQNVEVSPVMPTINPMFINPTMAPMPLSPAFAALFYTYFNFMQYTRFQRMGMM